MRTRAFLALPLAWLLVSCSSSSTTPTPGGSSGTTTQPKDGGITGDGGVSTEVELIVLPQAAYTGFDGVHPYKVPISVAGAASDLTLTGDTAFVDIKRATSTVTGEEQWFLVTAKKAGKVTLVATSKGKKLEATLTIASYTPAQWTTGETRYKNGGAEPSCASCHSKSDGPDHSPTTLSPIDDESAKLVITTGVKGSIPITSVKHKWTATPDELIGLVTYLRALPPKGITEK